MAHVGPLDQRLPLRVTVAAALLAACIALPVDRHGDASLLRLLIEAWHEDWLSGTLLALVVAAPHGFALALVLASRSGGAWSSAAVRAWVTLMQAELVVFALLVLHELPRHHDFRAPWALIGFAFITALRFAQRVASTHPTSDARELDVAARWGALLIVGLFGWGELQLVGRGAVGPWFHATLGAAFLLAAVARRR